MPTYLYRGAGTAAPTVRPDPESALDALADHLLAQPNVQGALDHLRRHGFPQRDGSRHPGASELAQEVREAQRALKRRYSFDSLTKEFSDGVRSALRDELRATESHFRARADRRAAEFDALETKLRTIGEHAAGPPAGGGKRLRQFDAEDRFEDLYLQVNEALAEARADQQEERDRLEQLAQMPGQPVDAAKRLAEYPFLSESAASRVASLSAARPRMADLAASEWRHAYTGAEPVGADSAERVTGEMRDLDRLEGRLRGGRLGEIDPRTVGATLGPPAQQALESLQRLDVLLEHAGYLREDDGGVRLTPRAMRRLGQRALQELFTALRRTTAGEHEAGVPGPGVRPAASVRPYEPGDPFHPHLNETLFRAAARAPRVPLSLRPSDFMMYQSDAMVHSATALLIDTSLSMHRHGRMLAAKKVALALDTLIRTRFPKDTLELVGFSTVAYPLSLVELPDVTTAPSHPFTNMEDGLHLATQLLRRHRGANRQVILITDGEPTATRGDHGHVRTCYPPDEAIFTKTLDAVRACTAHGIVINIVMLNRDPAHVEFVRRIAHVNRGRALYCTPETLGRYVLFDYLRGKRLAMAGR